MWGFSFLCQNSGECWRLRQCGIKIQQCRSIAEVLPIVSFCRASSRDFLEENSKSPLFSVVGVGRGGMVTNDFGSHLHFEIRGIFAIFPHFCTLNV